MRILIPTWRCRELEICCSHFTTTQVPDSVVPIRKLRSQDNQVTPVPSGRNETPVLVDLGQMQLDPGKQSSAGTVGELTKAEHRLLGQCAAFGGSR